MKKSVEILEKIEAVKNEMKVLKANGDLEKAHAKIEEVKSLRNEYEIELELENNEVINKASKKPLEGKMEKPVDKAKTFENALKKKFSNRANLLTPVENDILTENVGSAGGYLLPVQFINAIEELRRQYVPLKQYCRVISVSSPTGTMPMEKDGEDSALINFTSGTNIATGNYTFDQVAWNLSDYGKIIGLSASLLADENVNLAQYIAQKFSKASVLTENAKILAIMNKARAITGTDYTAITKALNKELDPAISATSVIFTNQDGFDYLDGLKDAEGRPLLSQSLADATQKMYKGRAIVVLSNAHMPSVDGKLNFYVGDLSTAVAFFDRGAYELATSSEAGFTTNTVLSRCIERFDVQALDNAGLVCVQIATATASK